MNNKDIVDKFYISFQELNAAGMNSCYHEEIAFFDPVFGLLNGDEVRYMWRMLCSRATDFSLAHGPVTDLEDGYYNCDWTATYTFSPTGKTVVNRVKAHMKIVDGKITEHSDAYSLHKWASQAFGFTGWLLGWNRFFQQRIKNDARRNLLHYMQP